MLALLLLLFLLVSACVGIHGFGMIVGLRWLGRTSPRHGHHFSLPAMFWIFMIVGGFLLTGYATILAGNERRLGQVIFILPVTLLLLSSIYLVGVFEQPFQGPNALQPHAMKAALTSVTDFVPDPRANRPCP